MREIKLSKGLVALVDNEDFEYLNQWRWIASFSRCSNTHYAHRNLYLGGGRKNPIRKTICMHRLIMNTPEGMLVDHKDGNGLNNQKSNLRNCNKAHNAINRRKLKAKSSKYKGVYMDNGSGKWRVVIKFDKKTFHIGRFASEIDAAKRYNDAALKYHGEYANLNEIML